MKIKLFILLLVISVSVLFSQNTEVKKYWIFFKDKGPGVNEKLVLSKNSILQDAARAGISERALQRRAKTLTQDKIIDFTDLPVYHSYIQKIEDIGFKVANVLKWFNAVTIYCNEGDFKKIRNFDFIKEIKPVTILKYKSNPIDALPEKLNKNSSTTVIHKMKYGVSSFQNEMINVPKVHDMGITGKGVIVGMLDTGFDWEKHNSLNTRKVLGEYDFIFKDSITRNDTANGDWTNQDSHGTLTFSTLGGYAKDTLVGPAFESSFLLAKTEDVRTETRVEEDNWVKAIEWMEGLGVDVTSTSLGYNEFDNAAESYTYKDMNGNTAIMTKAADLAVTKGVVCVNAAGNEGNSSWKYIIVPCDGKYVIAVGAANRDSSRASFSSIGPTYDGRIKPDVSALGVGVYGAATGTKNLYNPANGTSLSCPLVGGVAALILSARPELTPAQVTEALKKTASRSNNPDNQTGYGVINAYKAVTYHGLVYSYTPEITVIKNSLLIKTYIASKYIINKQSAKIFYSVNDQESLISLSLSPDTLFDNTNSGRYSVTIPGTGLKKIKFYFLATDETGERVSPQSSTGSFFNFQTDAFSGVTIDEKPSEYRLFQNYPNPFNPHTNIRVTLKEDLNFKLEIYNSLGQTVNELFSGKRIAGSYNFLWNGLNSEGKPVPSGVYYYSIFSDKFSETRSMLLVR